MTHVAATTADMTAVDTAAAVDTTTAAVIERQRAWRHLTLLRPGSARHLAFSPFFNNSCYAPLTGFPVCDSP